MRLLIVIIMVMCLWVCTVPFSHTEPTAVSQETSQSPAPAAAQKKPLLDDASEPDLIETLESIHAMTKSAEVAAKTIGRTLGQYVRQKYNVQQQREIITRFNASLGTQLAALSLTPAERGELIVRIEEAYIKDSETNTNQLDQNYFRDLPHVVKKEYSELRLAKTQDGTVQTYDYDGNLKSKWTLRGGIPQGPAITYYSSGEIKFIDLYENGERISRKKYDEEGKLIFEQDYSYEKKQEPVVPKIEEIKKEEPVQIPKDEGVRKEEPKAQQAGAPVVAFAAPAVRSPVIAAPAPAPKTESPAVSEPLAIAPKTEAPVASEPPVAAPSKSDAFVVPVTYSKESAPQTAPAGIPVSQASILKELKPEDGKIEVIFKETRTQSVQNETQNAGTAVSAQGKSLL